MLRRLDPADRAFFAQVSHGCRAGVLASELPCAGTRVGLGPLNPADQARLAEAVQAFDPDAGYSQLEVLGSLGYVEASDVPRAGRVVRLELSAFCTSAGRLAWAKAGGCRWNELTCGLAAQGGHLEALKWARELECPWLETRMCVYAARGGHLDVLKWLREVDCPWNAQTCQLAAAGGHLATLQWARENDCPWDIWTCHAAAEGGRLKTLKWARDVSCPWDELTCEFAVGGGHLEVLQWAREHGCEWDEWNTVLRRRSWRAPDGVAVGAGARLRVGRGPRPRSCRSARTPGCVDVAGRNRRLRWHTSFTSLIFPTQPVTRSATYAIEQHRTRRSLDLTGQSHSRDSLHSLFQSAVP